MRCRICQESYRIIMDSYTLPHHWKHQHCARCHYFKPLINRGSKKYGVPRGMDSNTKKEYHFVPITENNIELFCKVSQIIRGKPCHKNLVLSHNRNVIMSQLDDFKQFTEESEYDEPIGLPLS